MNTIINSIPSYLTWPVAIMFAWIVGEFGHKWTNLPRISLYGFVGFALASPQIGLLPHAPNSTILLLANIAFGLILFEFGYRINLHWLHDNPWIGLTGLVVSILTFAAVYILSRWCNVSVTAAGLFSALAMSTSPAAVVRIINEERSSGQVTERVLHLSAINCILAVFAFKVIVSLEIFQVSGNPFQTLYISLIMLMVSAILGIFFGILMPAILRILKGTTTDGTIAFAIAVIFLVALTHALKLSPLLSTFAFGFMARHRRIVMSPTQRNFGALGDLLVVLLFVFIATTVDWKMITSGLVIGIGIIVVRFFAQTIGVILFARISGISWRKGFLVAIAMAPISTFVILVLEQARYLGINVVIVDQLAPLAALSFILEVFAPIATQRALIWANEVHRH